ncbi:MAG: ATP-binding cassette domain-containing protein [Cyclobacteriaceae bacterium]
MISSSNLSYSFNKSVNLSYPDWKVGDGEHGLILGNSGSGKTTFLHLLSGLLKPTSGTVKFDDTDITELKSGELDVFRGKHVGLVFQKPHLISALSVSDNLRLATFLGRKSEQDARIEELLDSLGLDGLGKRRISEISQGQAQRVSIARALINHPKVIFGDEPTASLDDSSCEKVIDILQKQADKQGATLILATHDHRVKSHFSNQMEL